MTFARQTAISRHGLPEYGPNLNPDETPLDSRADHVFREDVTEVLPAIRDAMG